MDQVLKLLFGTWTGLLTVFSIAFMIGMVIFLATYFIRKSGEPHQ
ncbi:MAG TPA: DUF3149 domain-containing protein [Gammaproteobacteria bacterium]|nr:DUF3149 domain-containing protein [Gammaproteobacteria bacterium]